MPRAVRRHNKSERPATSISAAADVELGQDDSAGKGFITRVGGYYNSTAQSIQLNSPGDVWTDGSGLLVSDSGNNRVLYWQQVPQVNNTTAYSVIGQPSGFSATNPGTSVQTLNNPVGVLSAANQLFVADTGNNRVLVYGNAFSTTTRGLAAIGVFGQQDFSHSAYNDDDQNGQPGDQRNGQSNINATQNTLNSPTGAFVIAGNLFVSDRGNNRITEYPVNAAVDGTDTSFCNGYVPIPPN